MIGKSFELTFVNHSLIKCINSLPIDILDFEQLEKESIGAAWARFLRLLASSSDLSIPDDVSLNIFCSGLDIKSVLDLDIAAKVCLHRQHHQKEEIDFLLENSSFPTNHNEPIQEERELSVWCSSSLSNHTNI